MFEPMPGRSGSISTQEASPQKNGAKRQGQYMKNTRMKWKHDGLSSNTARNHYKAHLLTTKHYSQWYKTHHMAQTISKDNDKETNGPSSKKFKTMVKDDHTCVSQADTPPKDSDIDDNDDNDNDNNDNPKPSWLKDNVQEGSSRGISRPKARPLRDPL